MHLGVVPFTPGVDFASFWDCTSSLINNGLSSNVTHMDSRTLYTTDDRLHIQYVLAMRESFINVYQLQHTTACYVTQTAWQAINRRQLQPVPPGVKTEVTLVKLVRIPRRGMKFHAESCVP